MAKPMVVIIQHSQGVDVRHTDDVTVLWVDDECARDRVYKMNSIASAEALTRYVGPRKHWSNLRVFALADPLAGKRAMDARDPHGPHSLYPSERKPMRRKPRNDRKAKGRAIT